MKTKKIFMSILGVAITAVSIGAFKYAMFGVDPFQSFMSGIDALIPLSFGTLYILVNAVLLLFAVIFGKHYIGIATFINLFLLGYMVEFTLTGLEYLFPAPSIILRCLLFSFGFLFLCFGSSIYMTADMGVSTYDAIAMICSKNWRLGKFRTIRIITDFLCIVFGITMFLLSGKSILEIPTFVGVGTLITAFCMGPFIDFFSNRISRPMLAILNNKSQ